MDLSVYITELLNTHGAINIPQIGVFKQVRMRGQYNADEGKLYPPYYQVQFQQIPVEDDSLLQLLTANSKISLTSAKYLLDKYLQNILQQAEIGEVMIGRLGWLSKEGDQLQFRPSLMNSSAPSVFGFTPVKVQTEPVVPVQQPQTGPDLNAEPLQREDQTPSFEQDSTQPIPTSPVPEPVITQPVMPLDTSTEKESNLFGQGEALPVAIISDEADPLPGNADPSSKESHLNTDEASLLTPNTTTKQQTPATPTFEEPVYHEPAKPVYTKPWFIGLVAGLIILAAIITLYRSNANQTVPSATTTVKASPTPSTDSVVIKPTTTVKDTFNQPEVKTDTTASNVAQPASTGVAPNVTASAVKTASGIADTNNYKFVLMSGAFSNAEAANKVVNRYKAIGVEANILKNVAVSKYVKVTLGFFKTYAEGQAAKARLVKLKHLRSSDLYVETLRTKQK